MSFTIQCILNQSVFWIHIQHLPVHMAIDCSLPVAFHQQTCKPFFQTYLEISICDLFCNEEMISPDPYLLSLWMLTLIPDTKGQMCVFFRWNYIDLSSDGLKVKSRGTCWLSGWNGIYHDSSFTMLSSFPLLKCCSTDFFPLLAVVLQKKRKSPRTRGPSYWLNKLHEETDYERHTIRVSIESDSNVTKFCPLYLEMWIDHGLWSVTPMDTRTKVTCM